MDVSLRGLIVDHRPFTDGIERDVCEDAEGRQHGLDVSSILGLQSQPGSERQSTSQVG
jgi:hypothetical protein